MLFSSTWGSGSKCGLLSVYPWQSIRSSFYPSELCNPGPGTTQRPSLSLRRPLSSPIKCNISNKEWVALNMSLETFNCEYEQRRGGDHINIVQSKDHTDAEYFGRPWENITFFFLSTLLMREKRIYLFGSDRSSRCRNLCLSVPLVKSWLDYVSQSSSFWLKQTFICLIVVLKQYLRALNLESYS